MSLRDEVDEIRKLLGEIQREIQKQGRTEEELHALRRRVVGLEGRLDGLSIRLEALEGDVDDLSSP